MKLATRKGDYTYEDFCVLVKDGQKADLIDGVIYMASPESTEANDLFVWLIWLVSGFVDLHELGKVYGSRVAFRISDKHSPEPDIGFVAAKNQRRIRRGHVKGSPDLAIEFVSPESVERDYVRKRFLYERAGVREYWIIDQMKERITLLRRTATGRFREVRSKDGELHSRVLPGFWIRLEWLWQDPLPKKQATLNLILSRGA